MTTKQAAKLLNVTSQTVGNRLRRLGYEKEGRDFHITKEMFAEISQWRGPGRPKGDNEDENNNQTINRYD